MVVGALGPKMRRLGATEADGVLPSWLTTDAVASQSRDLHAVEPTVHVALYVRAALEDAAVPRLRKETRMYAGFPQYAAHFERLGIDPEHTAITPEAAADDMARYRDAVDEVVLRAITPTDASEDYARFVQVAARLRDETR